MENSQPKKPSKAISGKEEIKNTLKGQQNKRQRTTFSLGSKGRKELDTLKQNSSQTNPKDSFAVRRAIEFTNFHKQDVNVNFEKFATLSDIEKINKRHIGKLNAAFEIFQAENFQSQQFSQQTLKQLSQKLAEISKILEALNLLV